MKKLLIVLTILLALTAVYVPAYAQGTLLPKAEGDVDCDDLLTGFAEFGFTSEIAANKDQMLGCAIVTGRVSMPMIPYFIQYFSNYALGLVSILALLFIVIGGFLYTLGGMTEQKDKGKNFIKNAIIGMIIAFMAWTIVNVIISAVTG